MTRSRTSVIGGDQSRDKFRIFTNREWGNVLFLKGYFPAATSENKNSRGEERSRVNTPLFTLCFPSGVKMWGETRNYF
jgi:hypothetical protein